MQRGNSFVMKSECHRGVGGFLQTVNQSGNLLPVLVGGMNLDHEQLDVEQNLLFALRQTRRDASAHVRPAGTLPRARKF